MCGNRVCVIMCRWVLLCVSVWYCVYMCFLFKLTSFLRLRAGWGHPVADLLSAVEGWNFRITAHMEEKTKASPNLKDKWHKDLSSYFGEQIWGSSTEFETGTKPTDYKTSESKRWDSQLSRYRILKLIQNRWIFVHLHQVPSNHCNNKAASHLVTG